MIGTGGSGLRAAIELAEAGVDVLALGKRPKSDAHTSLAAGGINAALATMDADDSWQQHAADTLKESYLLANPHTVEIVTSGAARGIEDLERYGMPFAREDDGRISQRFFGAHKYRRTAFAGDYTGLEIQRTLINRAAQLNVPILDTVYVTRILVNDDGAVFGAYGFDLEDGTRYLIHADAVILAAGGHNRIWRRTSSRRDENTGDSFRLAVEAGGRLRDPELVQFHPSGIIEPENAAGTLISEAARGEGGILTNGLGERFMAKYDPERHGALHARPRGPRLLHRDQGGPRHPERRRLARRLAPAPRDDHDAPPPRLPDHARAADARHHEGADRDRAHRALLDGRRVGAPRRPRHGCPGALRHRRGILRAARRQPPGRQLAHRAARLRTHRRAGRGRRTRRRSTRSSGRHPQCRPRATRSPSLLASDGSENVRALQRAIRDTMTEHAGVVRDEDGLRAGLAELDAIEARIGDIGVHPDIAGYQDLAHAFDLKSAALAARATLEAALERRETRGCHNRSDYPETRRRAAGQPGLVAAPQA